MKKYLIKKPVRLIELFGGIGAQAKALEYLGVDFERYRLCEIDKNAVKTYNAIHGTNFVPSSIMDWNADDLGVVNTEKYDYMLTWSWPCQSNSVAGKGGGFAAGSGTASSIVWEVIRLLESCDEKPQVLIMENVVQCRTGKNKATFDEVLSRLEKLGYCNFIENLQSKNYGIPQSRNRCFMVSILGDDFSYEFPEQIELKHTVDEYFEDEVDEKWYVKKEKAEPLIKDLIKRGELDEISIVDDTQGFDGVRYYRDYAPTLRASRSGLKTVHIVAMRGRYKRDVAKGETPTKQRLELNGETVANCITTVAKDSMCLEEYIVYDDYNSHVREDQSTIGTLTTTIGHKALRNGIKLIKGYTLRTLTNKEALRLMDFTDEDANRAIEVTCKSQLSKQAGNSIVVNCLVAVMGQFFEGKEDVYVDRAGKLNFTK